ncbi:Uncharacterised protein [Raoultella terrigena]|nr:Uncharacterised protein [Raoultella terrigena]
MWNIGEFASLSNRLCKYDELNFTLLLIYYKHNREILYNINCIIILMIIFVRAMLLQKL